MRSLHAKNGLVLTLALVGSIAYGCHAAASLACGGGIQIVNLIALDGSLKTILPRAAHGAAGALRPLLLLRFAIVAAAVGVALAALPLDVVPFVIGLSTVVPAALWHGLQARKAVLGGGPVGEGR